MDIHTLWNFLTVRAPPAPGGRVLHLNRLLRTLGAINPALLRAENEQQLFANICRTLVEQGGFSMAWVGMAEPATRRVRIACQTGFAHGYLEQLDIRYDDSPTGRGPTGTAIRTGRTTINEDTETNERFAPWRERAHQHGYRSTAAIPLRVDRQVVGSLNVYAALPHAFGAEEVVLLEKLAGDVGMAIERLRAMARIEMSERELATILRNMQDTYYRTDADGRVVRASESATELFGYTPQEVVGTRHADYFPEPDDYARFLAALQAAGGTLQNYVAQLRHRDGSVLWMSTNAHYVRDAAGQTIGIEGTVRNVTERMTAELALRASEARYRSTLEATAEGIVVQDASGRIVSCNPAAEQILGLTREQMMGQTLADPRWRAVHEDGSPFPGDSHPAMVTLRTGMPQSNVILGVHKPDGSLGWISINSQPLAGTGESPPHGVVSSFHDITLLRMAAEALRASETLLAHSQEVAHLGSFEWNLRTNEVLWSRETYRLFGLDPDHPPADIWALLARAVHPEDQPRLQASMRRVIEHGAREPMMLRIRWPDGSEHALWSEGEVQRDADGRPERMVGTMQDITARRRAEESLLEIARGVSATTGDSFFQSLVEHLARALQADFAYVGALIPNHHDHIRTIALLADGKRAENFEYALAGTPGQTVVGKETRSYPREVQKQFPDDRWLAEMGAHAYVGTPLFAADGSALGLVTVLYRHPIEEDASIRSALEIFAARAAAEIERLHAEAQMLKLSSAIEQTADSIVITDHNGIIEYVNPAFEHNTGYTRAESLGKTPRLVKSDRQGAGFFERLWQTILRGEVFSDVLINRRKDGTLYYEEKTITPLKDASGRITHFVSTGKDVTERMQTQEHLQFLAQHDVLTALPNRVLLLDRLKQSMARSRWRDRLVAVLFMDLDRFKTINDTLGHEAGDLLLQQLGERFRRSVREGDTVARFGGDEFVILLDDVASDTDVRGVAQKVLDALATPFTVNGQSLYITTSIGISLFPADGEDSGTLLKNADIAMYRAKELGKNTYQFYSADMSARAFERLSLETSLRRALERGEFRLHYQPQLNIVNGRIIGLEALLRWQHPEFGLVAPVEFIPLLEETGLIIPVGEWVLTTACAQLRHWQAAGWPDLRMAVNLSARQFQNSTAMASLESNIAQVGCVSGLLELEITESILLQHAGTTLETLGALRTAGVRLAIDDFGTGYSSLSYLRRFPIDTLKIDRSFVHDIPADPDDSAITTAIAALANSLKLEMIAEGVETEAQRDFLRALGCTLMQGNLFSRPLPADGIQPLLERHNPRAA